MKTSFASHFAVPSLSRACFRALGLGAILAACFAVLPGVAHAYTIRGTGEAALVGHDLTDPEDDGDSEANPPVGYNATFSSSEEPGFGNGTTPFANEAAFNVFDNQADAGGNDKWCCGDHGNFPSSPLFIDATFPAAKVLRHFTLTSGEDAPERDPLVWEIQGSNDGVNFTTIYARNNPTTAVWTDRRQVVEFVAGIDYAVPAAYTTFRFTVSKTQSLFQLSEIEYFDTPPESLVVTAAADEDNGTSDPSQGMGTSLREALNYAASLSGPQTIAFSTSAAFGAVNFHDGTARTITLGGSELVIASDVTITGPGAKVLAISGGTGSHANRVFQVNSGKTATLAGLTIKDGKPLTRGGGILNHGMLTIENATIADNTATSGGGISNEAGATLTIRNSAITGNSCGSSSGGGGIFNANAALTIDNSTIARNVSEAGGGIQSAGTLTLRNSTVTGNSAGSNGVGGGIESAFGVSTILENSIVAGNTAGVIAPDIHTAGGTDITSNGFNFIGDTTGTGGVQPGDKTFASTMTTLADLLETAAGVPVLEDNGGPTFTIALVPGSPALDAGDPMFDPNAFTPALTFDQRGLGFDRIVKGKMVSANPIVDIGAFEVQVITFAPGVAANGVNVDANDGPFDLTGTTIGATPAGGTFSGPGVDANGVFHIGLLVPGIYSINYQTSTPDAFGNTGSVMFTIRIGAANPYVRLVATSGPGGTGIDVPNEPAGTKFTQLGLASMDDASAGMGPAGLVCARVRIQPQGGAEVPAIYQGTAATALPSFLGGQAPAPGGIVVRGGDAAPDGNGGALGTFASFNEPVFAAGYVAFGATIAGNGVSKTNDTGLWSTSSGQLDLAAAESATAPDIDGNPMTGVQFDRFTSYVLAADGETLTFVATLKGTAVKSANKVGVFQYTPALTRLIFRTGDLFNFDGSDHAVKALKIFVPAKTIPGQRRNYGSESHRIVALATFAGGREASIQFVDFGFFNFRDTVLVNKSNVGKPGMPSINRFGQFAMRGKLTVGAPYTQGPGKVTGRTDDVILNGSGQFNVGIFAQEGSEVSGTIPDLFAKFEEPAFNDNFAVAFFADVKRNGLPASQKHVLFFSGPPSGYNRVILARTATPAADLAGGETYKGFTAMVLPEADYGPVFLATLSGPAVDKTNNIGLWATDTDGSVRLLVRTGDVLRVNDVHKTVSLITTLGAAMDSPGQGRYVAGPGDVSARLTFTDGTVALAHFGMPIDPNSMP